MCSAAVAATKDRAVDHKGFTLVELIVVLTLMMMLVMISVFGLLSWQDWTNEQTYGEYRQTLFVSVQDKLTKYQANNTLDEFAAKLSASNSLGSYDGYKNVYRLECRQGDYERFLRKGKTAVDAEVLFGLLSDVIVDGNILNERMYVVFDLDRCIVIDAEYGEGR